MLTLSIPHKLNETDSSHLMIEKRTLFNDFDLLRKERKITFRPYFFFAQLQFIIEFRWDSSVILWFPFGCNVLRARYVYVYNMYICIFFLCLSTIFSLSFRSLFFHYNDYDDFFQRSLRHTSLLNWQFIPCWCGFPPWAAYKFTDTFHFHLHRGTPPSDGKNSRQMAKWEWLETMFLLLLLLYIFFVGRLEWGA